MAPEQTVMGDASRVILRPRRARTATARTAVAVIATVCLTLLLAACGGSPLSYGSGRSSNTGGSTNSQSSSSQLLAFAQCMRSKGVPNFPDISNDAKFPRANALGISDSQFQTADNACKHLLPNGGGGTSQAELQQQRAALLPFSRCMRSHGVSNWPDPSIQTNPTGTTAVVFDLIGLQGLDYNGITSPQVQATVRHCQHLLPPSHGGPPFRIMRR